MPPPNPMRCPHHGCAFVARNGTGLSSHMRACSLRPDAPAPTEDERERERERNRKYHAKIRARREAEQAVDRAARELSAVEAAGAAHGAVEVPERRPYKRRNGALNHEADLLAMVALAFPHGIPTADQMHLAHALRWITATHTILSER
jgi:hypothetical protein